MDNLSWEISRSKSEFQLPVAFISHGNHYPVRRCHSRQSYCPTCLIPIANLLPPHNTRFLHTRRARIARRHIQRWVLQEEIPGPEQQSHWLSRHDRIVFRGWEMRDTKGVPEHNVGVVDALVAVLGDPFG